MWILEDETIQWYSNVRLDTCFLCMSYGMTKMYNGCFEAAINFLTFLQNSEAFSSEDTSHNVDDSITIKCLTI
jgi:hypothetical protein